MEDVLSKHFDECIHTYINTVGRGSVRASSLESRKPAVYPNNSSKFKPAAGSSSTVAGTKNGSVSEKGASSNGIEYCLSYNAYIHEHIICLADSNDSDSNHYDSDEEQMKERKPRSFSLGT